ncbi:AAA family ATPase [bacterium]|jgi:hypothetical protein|nr:AAA family ATPase [bacterium]
MKQVFLQSLSMVNFRGHKDLTVQFSDQTTISGENATGKSTVFDAFVWLLFGKDQFDRKDFEIIPTVDNKRLDRVDPEVTAVLLVDGREISLKRVLHQKWVRRRGTAEEVFDGCDTLYYMNDVPLKAAEFKGRVDMITEETIFKLITNPATFLGLHWTKQREILFQIAGTISDAQIAASDPRFASLLELVNGKSLVEFKKELSARKKKLKDDLDDIQPRIDQTTRLMPETKDFDGIESEIVGIERKIKGIDMQLSDRSAAIREQYEGIQQKQGQINGLKTKQTEIVNAAKAKAVQDAFDQNQDRTALSNQVTAALNNLKAAETDRDTSSDGLATLRKKALTLEGEIQKLREEWETENAKEYKAQEGCLVCPVFGTECGDAQATGKHQEAQLRASLSFINSKETKLDQINEDGGKKTEDLKFINGRIKDGEKYLEEATQKVTELNTKHVELTAQLNSTQIVSPAIIVAAELPEWQKIEADIKAIDATIQEVAPVDNSDLNQQKSELTTKRDQLKKDLSSKDLIAQYKQEVKNLEEQGKQLSQQIADLEKTEFTMEAFNKAKIDECDRRINGLFKITRFQLFDKTNDGNEFEACIATNRKGVPIAATNTAERINAGLDIISTLSTFYNVSAPIFCDGSESVNTYLNAGSQMIYLRVTKEPMLTISNN